MTDGGMVPITLAALRKAGWWAERLQAGTARGGAQKLARAGAPDIIAIAPSTQSVPAEVVMIECKTKSGKLNSAQSDTQKWCRVHGVEYFVIRSTDDVAQLVARY